MANHLARFHSIFKHEQSPTEEGTEERGSIVATGILKNLTIEEQEDIDNALVKYIAASHAPLATVEKEEFQALIQKLDPRYALPTRQPLREMILKECEKIKEQAMANTPG